MKNVYILVPMFPTPRPIHSTIWTQERQNTEFSLAISVSFPLLSATRTPVFIQATGTRVQCQKNGHGTNLGYNFATGQYIAVNRNETFTTEWLIHMTIILQKQRVKTEKVDTATGGKKKQLLCIDEYHWGLLRSKLWEWTLLKTHKQHEVL